MIPVATVRWNKGWRVLTAGILLAGICSTVFVQAQNSTGEGKTVSQKKFSRLIKKKNTVLVDVRTFAEYKTGHIPGSLQIDVEKTQEFGNRIASWDKTRTYFLYCRSGKRSKEAMVLMKASGFKRLYDLEGGFSKWEGAKERQP